MRRALTEFVIAGANVSTTREFLLRVLEHPDFQAATRSTSIGRQLFEEGPVR